MRIAVFSDIHGNYTGLQAVLAAIAAHGGADLLIAAGNHIWGESGGDDLLDLLSTYRVRLIRGDSDTEDKLIELEQRATLSPGSTRGSATYYQSMRAWLHHYLSPATRAMLAALPIESVIEVDTNQSLYVCHASPQAVNDRMCAPSTPPLTVRHAYSTVDATIIAFGHWHSPYVRWLDQRVYVNVASVGFRDDGLSRFTMLTYHAGQWVVEQHVVPYDVAAEERRKRERHVPVA